MVVKSFSGASTEDIEDYLKPLLRKESENLILHIGTNDLKMMEPDQLTDSILSLALQVESDSPNTSLSISAILPRKEADQLNENVSLINSYLKLLCRQHRWSFIDHKNINHNHLNRSGLHLTKVGNDILAKNFKDHSDSEQDSALPCDFTDFTDDRTLNSSNQNELFFFLPSTRGFKLASLNITSLPKHIDELRVLLADSPVDVLSINETRPQ